MCLLDGSYTSELLCQLCETFFFSFISHSCVHVCPFCILAFCCVEQICRCVAKFSQSFEPELSVLLLVLSSLKKQGSNLLIACLLGY